MALNTYYVSFLYTLTHFSLKITQGGNFYDYALFIDEETEAQSDEVTSLEAQS